MNRLLTLALIASLAVPATAGAQTAIPDAIEWRHDASAAPLAPTVTSRPAPFPGLGLLRRWAGVGKWVTIAATAGFAGFGFAAHQDAERLFDDLEARCEADPDRCRQQNPDGSYADPELEGLFQRVLDRDASARTLLIGSQVTFAASVVFFVLDLKGGKGPENIPYEPKELRVSVRPNELRLTWPAPW